MFSVASMLCRCTTFGTGEEGTPPPDAANVPSSPSVLPDGALAPPGVDAGSNPVPSPTVHYAGSPTGIQLRPSRMHAAASDNGKLPRFFDEVVEPPGKSVAVEAGGGTRRWPLENPNNGFAMLSIVSSHMDVRDSLVGVGLKDNVLKVGEGRGGSTINATAVATAGGLIYIAHEKRDGFVVSEIPVAQSSLEFGDGTVALRLRNSLKTPFIVSPDRLSLIRPSTSGTEVLVHGRAGVGAQFVEGPTSRKIAPALDGELLFLAANGDLYASNGNPNAPIVVHYVRTSLPDP